MEPDPDDKETPTNLPIPGEKLYLITDTKEKHDQKEGKKQKEQKTRKDEARRVWLVSPQTELALDTKVGLKVEPGLISYLGPEKGAENRMLVEFHTFPEFAFEGIECTGNNKKKITIDPDKIGGVIGSGGKTIRAIIEETKASVDIDNDGTVLIGSPDEASARKAIEIIESLTKDVEVGNDYTGKVTRILNFGAK